MRFFGFLKDNTAPEPEKWEISLSQDAVNQVNQIPMINQLQTDYRASTEAISDAKDTLSQEDKIKGKFWLDIPKAIGI